MLARGENPFTSLVKIRSAAWPQTVRVGLKNAYRIKQDGEGKALHRLYPFVCDIGAARKEL